MTEQALNDQWSWWRAAITGVRAPITADDPESGFYETQWKNRQTGVVTRGVIAYWRDEAGNLRCRDGAKRMVDDMRARERWPFASKRPIPHPTYKHFIETGKFPDEHAAAHRDRLQNSADAPDADSFEALKDRIEDLSREAEKLIARGAAKSTAESDTAADLADRLRKLESKADDLRAKEKQPHLDEARGVDAQWCPIRDKAASAKERLKKLVITPFEVAERKRQQDAAKPAAPQGTAASASRTSTRRSAGTTSRVSLRDVKTAHVTDWTKTIAFFASNQKLRDLIQQLANAAVRQGTTPDGCEIHTDQLAA